MTDSPYWLEYHPSPLFNYIWIPIKCRADRSSPSIFMSVSSTFVSFPSIYMFNLQNNPPIDISSASYSGPNFAH